LSEQGEFLAFAGAIFAMMAVMVGASWALGPRRRVADKNPFESGVLPAHDTGGRFASPFYLVAMFFVIFDLEMVFVFAWGLVVRQAGWSGYFGMLAFLGFLLLGLAYLWRSGGLEWGPRPRRVGR
jgi:NADH-quinone oxidoreductase subunit A